MYGFAGIGGTIYMMLKVDALNNNPTKYNFASIT